MNGKNNTTSDALERASLASSTGSANRDYWQIVEDWIMATRARYANFASSDLTQVFMCGPFAGWSEREVKELADRLHENSTKYPVWPNEKVSRRSGSEAAQP